MKLTKEEIEISTNIDYALRANDDFTNVPLRHAFETEYLPWYGKLLTALTLTIGDQEIVYSQTNYNAEAGTVRFLLFTRQTLILVDASGVGTDDPRSKTRLIARRSLESLEVEASMRLDQDGAQSYGWPGLVQIAARYEGVAGVVTIADTGYQPGNSAVRGPILDLLRALQDDLAA